MSKLKIRTEQIIDLCDWDKLVKDTYKKPYSFQQQNGCRGRGMFSLCVPDEAEDTSVVVIPEVLEVIPEVLTGDEMGVSFSAWLKRDPKTPVKGERESWYIETFWERHFYPDIQIIANDLYNKGLLDAGSYLIDIDW